MTEPWGALRINVVDDDIIVSLPALSSIEWSGLAADTLVAPKAKRPTITTAAVTRFFISYFFSFVRGQFYLQKGRIKLQVARTLL
jgi:hypothetical protein